jgi:hypothetical protein
MLDSELSEAYQPPVNDGRSRFPEDLKAKAPKGMSAAIAAAAQIRNTTNAEYVRQAVLQCLASDGVKLRRGLVVIAA